MSVQTSTQALENALNEYEAARDAIQTDGTRSAEWKLEQLQALHERTLPAIEGLVARIWGWVLNDQGQHSLDASGEAWAEMEAAEHAIQAAQQAAERQAIDPAWLEHAKSRARALINMSERPADLLEHYATAALDTRYALQDYGAELLSPAQYSGLEWHQVRRRFEADRAARITTPALQRARAALAELMGSVEAAYNASQRAGNLFALRSGYLSSFMKGIERKWHMVVSQGEHVQALSINRRSWGIVARTATKFTIENGGGGIFG